MYTANHQFTNSQFRCSELLGPKIVPYVYGVLSIRTTSQKIPNLAFGILVVWILFGKPFLNLSAVIWGVGSFSKHVAIKCGPGLKGFTKVVRFKTDSGVSDVILDKMVSIFKNGDRVV